MVLWLAAPEEILGMFDIQSPGDMSFGDLHLEGETKSPNSSEKPSEDAELVKSTETESQTLAIEMHRKQKELKTLEQDVKGKDGQVKEGQNFYDELQDAFRDRETETELLAGELSALSTKIKRAAKNTSRLSLELRNKSPYPGIEEDIRIHLLREITRTVSDLLFSSVDSMPEINSKIQELYLQADLPLPSRTLLSLSFRSGIFTIGARFGIPLGKKKQHGIF
ncbi:coiled-coil domain-containing protein 39 [Trichonephila clavata]|uniref:Coiled-coil domain-containing protein 39 n=1 Tax=Trichonephila clavata TaxID=2740835 RepID=A0A8X6FKE6_TRICU|nr:coiled-coil domain-containing protein 39 [Trichonephila clavata]